MEGLTSGKTLRGTLEVDCDVVVIGSGAGGAVVATELAESGQRVVVLEEGPYVPPERHAAMRPTESIRHLWRDGAFTVAVGLGDSPAINVTMGRGVGGSSALTGGVCFRIPESVLDVWTKNDGLADFTAKAMEPFFDHVERTIHVEDVPVAMRSRSTGLFAAGAEQLGYPLKSLRRNTDGCKGMGQCNFGCPEMAKLSVDLSYLPRATKAGAQIFSHCLVEKVVTRGSRAVGVRGHLLNRDGGKKGDDLVVHAKRVVIACGAWHTPGLLKQSGLGKASPQIGRNLTLHPAFRVLARFDEDVSGWRGALQSAFTDAFEREGLTFVSLFVPLGVLGAVMPGVGPEHVQHARQIPNIALFGGLIHDHGGGTVRRSLGREPFVTYRMSPEDRARIPAGIRIMARTFFAAGAREVFLPVMGMRPVTADALEGIDLEKVPARRIECASQHPLGSCRMAKGPDRGVVDADGRVFGVDDLYVVDGGIVPTSLGVNPQLAIMSMATRIAWRMRDRRLPD